MSHVTKFVAVFMVVMSGQTWSASIAAPASAEMFPGPTARIVGGLEAVPGDWPAMVALVDPAPTPLSSQFCGGTLIEANWVLTAAHCVPQPGTSSADLEVATGLHNLASDTPAERIGVKSIIVHPSYNATTYDFDIALLQLNQPSTQSVMRLYNGASGLTGANATVIGWGSLSFGGSYPDALMQVDVPIVSNTVCNNEESYDGGVTDNMLCAGFPQGAKDACQGDSGGPLFVSFSDEFVQAGIVSWGNGCALASYYGVYARVSELTDFVKQYVSGATFYPVVNPPPVPGPDIDPAIIWMLLQED